MVSFDKGDRSVGRYVELEIREGETLDLVRDFDVLVALDFLAAFDKANRYRVPEFCCELSAFHDSYLRKLMCLAAESQLTHGWSKYKAHHAFLQIFCLSIGFSYGTMPRCFLCVKHHSLFCMQFVCPLNLRIRLVLRERRAEGMTPLHQFFGKSNRENQDGK